MWTLGRCIVYTGIRLLLCIHPFISSFFLSLQFPILKFIVTLFSRTVEPRRLKLGTQMDSWQIYRVYRNQAAAAYSFLYFFSFLSLQFSNIKIFCRTFLRNCEAYKVDTIHMWTMGGCIMYTAIRLLFLICPFTLSPIFRNLKFSSHFSQEP